jgi:hypothetical protein
MLSDCDGYRFDAIQIGEQEERGHGHKSYLICTLMEGMSVYA